MRIRKRGGLKSYSFVILILAVVLAMGSVSAGFSDWYKWITGRATTDTTTVSITVGNNAPIITGVVINTSIYPSEGNTRNVNFLFNATDIDGVGNLNDSTAQAEFIKGGETTRTNTSCALNSDFNATTATYNCTVGLWYFDGSGVWTVNVSVQDINSAYGMNSTFTTTFNLLTSFVMGPTALTWPPIDLTDTNTGSNNDPVVLNNTGNDQTLSINVTSFDLEGVTTSSEYIYANNFSIQNITTGCSGTTLINATDLNITSTILQRGNYSLDFKNSTSGQEEMFFCLLGVPQTISSQDYDSSAFGAWTIKIIT